MAQRGLAVLGSHFGQVLRVRSAWQPHDQAAFAHRGAPSRHADRACASSRYLEDEVIPAHVLRCLRDRVEDTVLEKTSL